jgi:hypothetical protein
MTVKAFTAYIPPARLRVAPEYRVPHSAAAPLRCGHQRRCDLGGYPIFLASGCGMDK